jgi:hypothetical protein
MKIEFAHLREKSTTGEMVDFAVFFAQANSDTDAAREEWLSQLVVAARAVGRKVDAAALVYEDGNRIKWWGHPFVVDYIERFGIPEPNYFVQF